MPLRKHAQGQPAAPKGHERRAFLDMPGRLALIGITGVVVAMAAALVAFNLFENWQVRLEAEASLNEAIGWEPSSGAPATRAVSYLSLTPQRTLDTDLMEWYSDLDVLIAAWCAHNAEPDVVSKVVFEDATCYVEMTKSEWDDYQEGWIIAYVDITAQQQLVATVNVVFVIITVVGATAAGLVGWRTGRRIEESETAQKRFFENMSHELKTPLAAIRGYAEGMEAGVVEPSHALPAIVRESERMRGIVDQIMGLSRLEAGAVTLRREPIEVADFVQDCLMPFEGVVRTRELAVKLELASGTVDADAELLGHALENILSNAMRHASSLVCISYDGHELVVSNDGDLPSKGESKHLFDRYYTSASSQGGTGIGLAFAKEVVELHGWTLSAETRDGLMHVTLVLT